MPKFHIEWKMNVSAMPDDPSKLGGINLKLLEMVNADLESNRIIDWGVYCNGLSGFTIMEGTHAGIMSGLLRYMPYVLFEVNPIVNTNQAMDAVNTVSKMMEK